MKHVALDIWDDLRQKRLWPVAAALLLAAIAIPIFMLKPAAQPAPAGPAPQAGQGQSTPAVDVVDDTSRESSRLGVFGKKDPFRPPAAALKPSTSAGSASAGSAAGASASPSTSSSSSPGSGSPPSSAGSSGGSGSSGGGGSPELPRLAPLPPKAYTYVVDLDFGREGQTRLRRGVPRLRALPSDLSPVVVFLGVSASGKRAVFLLNSAFEQSGEGTCRPSRATCNFLHLTTDAAKNSHRVADAKGVTYLLTLKAIRRVPVRKASRASRHSPRARAGAKSRAGAAPVFADEHR
jgi:hypothetical protein